MRFANHLLDKFTSWTCPDDARCRKALAFGDACKDYVYWRLDDEHFYHRIARFIEGTATDASRALEADRTQTMKDAADQLRQAAN